MLEFAPNVFAPLLVGNVFLDLKYQSMRKIGSLC